jgi:hypothetical protein
MRILFTLMVWAAASTCAAAEEVVTIPTRTGVTLKNWMFGRDFAREIG